MVGLEIQNEISITELDHPDFLCFLLYANTAHPTWGQVWLLSLPTSDLTCISFSAPPSPFGPYHRSTFLR